MSDARSSDGVGGIAKDENALASQVIRIDRTRIPRQAKRSATTGRRRWQARKLCDLIHEIPCRTNANRHGAREGLAQMALQKACRDLRDFRVKHDIEICVPQLREVRGRGRHGRGHHNLNAHAGEQFGDFGHIIAMPKAKGCRA